MKKIKVNKETFIFSILLLFIFDVFYPYKWKIRVLKEGEIALKPIIAPTTFKILKLPEVLNEEREKVAAQVPPVLKLIKERTPERLFPKVDSLITFRANESPHKNKILGEKEEIKEVFFEIYRRGIISNKENLPESESSKILIEGNGKDILIDRDVILSQKEAAEIFAQKIKEAFKPYEVKETFIEEIKKYIEPNLLIDFAETEKMRDEAKKSVSDSIGVVREGEKIIDAHEVVTLDIYRKLYSLRKHQDQKYYYSIFSILGRTQLYFIFVSLFVFIFIFFRIEKVYKNNKYLYLFLINISIILFLYRILPKYLIPLSSFVIFLSLSIGVDFGILLVLTSFLTISIYENFSVVNLIPIITGALVGGALSTNFKNREELYRIGFVVGGVTAFLILGIELYNNSSLINILVGFFSGVSNGAFSILILFGLLYVFERLFHITTNFTWMEYSDLNYPLLKRLAKEAPGTYQHALMVSTLAENAGEVIGANSLLAKVGGLFHDIGKLKRPQYFAENFKDNNNPHDELPPKLSAIIIKSHVKDAIEMAKENKLPEEIINIIKQHQGRSLIRPFYEKAKKMLDEVDEEFFRYNAELPTSKEASIIMLADMVEATVRSLDNPTLEEIQNTVKERINRAISNGLLSKSELSLEEIELIIQEFSQNLGGFYHHRPKYPTEVK
ncbi:MAG: HDIG domain-containing metalloprotein [candidate division WOR-3 bacterium]